jgi:hypothetical protein
MDAGIQALLFQNAICVFIFSDPRDFERGCLALLQSAAKRAVRADNRGDKMADLHLTLATKDYDHLQDLKNGKVKPEGISLT